MEPSLEDGSEAPPELREQGVLVTRPPGENVLQEETTGSACKCSFKMNSQLFPSSPDLIPKSSLTVDNSELPLEKGEGCTGKLD